MKKTWIYVLVPVLALSGVMAASLASAHGFWGLGSNLTPQQIADNQQTRFQKEADLLGISVDDVKNAWAKGESLQQLASDHGITNAQLQQKLLDARQQQLKDRLQTLVSQGVITQAQADQRLQFLQDNQNSLGGMMGRRGMMGWHMGL
jgi:hypothetical protein